MEYRETISKIKKYAIVSFVIPLLAINSCLMLYKFLGSIDPYWGFDWNKKVIEISVDEFRKIDHKTEKQRLTNCPKYNQQFYMSSYDGRKIKILKSTEKGWVENENLRMDLLKQNKIKSYIIEQGKIINNRCVKNHKLAYYILKKFTFLEKILLNNT